MKQKVKNLSSFTLLELLIVIGILAILATATILVINPMEYLRQSRDAARLTDLESLNKALSLADMEGVDLGATSTVYVSIPDTSSICNNLGLPSLPLGWTYNCVDENSLRKINGTGWVPVNFTSLTSGSPLSTLPVDPVNSASTSNYYTYIPGGSWALTSLLESEKYLKQNASKDGGTDDGRIEMGTDLSLWSQASGLVGYWKFDEGAGTIVGDSSDNNNNGNLTNGPQWANGKINKALSLDGVDDYVSIEDPAVLRISGDLTITSWIKTSNTSKDEMSVIFPSVGGINRNYQLKVVSGKLQFNHGNGVTTANYNSNYTVSDNNYNLVAFKADYPNYHFYVNGQEVANGTMAFDINPLPGSKKFSGNPTYINTIWDGLLDEIRIYSRSLSNAEIKALYDSAK